MEKVLLSVVAAVFLGGLVIIGVQVQRTSQTQVSRLEMHSELEQVRASLTDIEEGLEALGERIRAIEDRQVELENEVNRIDSRTPVRAVALEGEAKEQAEALLAQPDRLKEYVFAAIAEERELREKERQKEREAMRQRMEERRKEMEALSQGPYERYNLKVNSMAKVLNLTESQAQSYYELTKQYSEKLEQARREARERFLAAARQAQGGEGAASKEQPPGEGGRNRRRFDFAGFGEMGAQMRQVSEAIQKEYAEQVLGLLTVSQADVYNQLPEQVRSIQYLGIVTPPGEEPAMPFLRPFEGQGGPMRGGPPNAGAGRTGRGGRGGGR